eukprot:scaffold13909_cov63-Phaeocystis_antarctica.AAC.3
MPRSGELLVCPRSNRRAPRGRRSSRARRWRGARNVATAGPLMDPPRSRRYSGSSSAQRDAQRTSLADAAGRRPAQ